MSMWCPFKKGNSFFMSNCDNGVGVMISWWISISGLIVAMLGSGLLFLGTPFDSGGIHMFAFGDPEADIKKKKIERRRLFTRVGFAMLLLGFASQFYSLLLQYPNQ